MKTKSVLALLVLLASLPAMAESYVCQGVVTDSNGDQGASNYPIYFNQVGNLAEFKISHYDFTFQVSPTYNKNYPKGAPTTWEIGKIDTGESSSVLSVIRDNGVLAAVQLEVNSKGAQRVIMGLECVKDAN